MTGGHMAKILFYLSLCFYFFTNNSYATLKKEFGTAKVGLQTVDLNPPIGIPLAGYGDSRRRLSPIDWRLKLPHATLFKPSEGVRDPITARVMTIENNGKRVIFVSLDVIGVTWRFVKRLARKLRKHGIKRHELVISGTHTHSGPGTLTTNLPLALVAVDLYKRKNFNLMLNRTKNAILKTLKHAEEAYLYRASFKADGIQENKWRRQGEGWFDNSADYLLSVNKNGEIMGGMLNFAMHGNAMNLEDLRYSGDMPTAIAVASEDALMTNFKTTKRPTIVFMNGAEGDVRHESGARGEHVLEHYHQKFYQQALPALAKKNLVPVEPKVKVAYKKSYVAWPTFPIKICAKRDGYFKKWMDFVLPGRAGGLPIQFLFPFNAHLSAIQIGDITMMTWPGEASTEIGFRLKDMAKANGHQNPWFLGLTNGYMAYFTTKEEYHTPDYDSCSTMYGYKGQRRIIKAHKKLIKRL
jgi:hypothetical protein